MDRKPLPVNNGGMPHQLSEQLCAGGSSVWNSSFEGVLLGHLAFVFVYLTLCSWESQKHGNTLPVWLLLLQQFGADPKHRVTPKLVSALSCTCWTPWSPVVSPNPLNSAPWGRQLYRKLLYRITAYPELEGTHHQVQPLAPLNGRLGDNMPPIILLRTSASLCRVLHANGRAWTLCGCHPW